jgi:hypothetical protein
MWKLSCRTGLLACPSWCSRHRVGGASRPRPPTPPYVLNRIRRFLRLIQRQVPPRPVLCRTPRAAKTTASAAGWFRLAAELWPTPPYRMWRCLSADPPSDLSVCSLQSKIQPFTAALAAAAATMASADFSGAVPSGYPNGSPMFWTEPEISSGKTRLLLADPPNLPHRFGMTIGFPRPWPGGPTCNGLIFGFCTSNPRFRHRLSSDPASRRAPLPRRMVPVITVHGGLSPLECKSY